MGYQELCSAESQSCAQRFQNPCRHGHTKEPEHAPQECSLEFPRFCATESWDSVLEKLADMESFIAKGLRAGPERAPALCSDDRGQVFSQRSVRSLSDAPTASLPCLAPPASPGYAAPETSHQLEPQTLPTPERSCSVSEAESLQTQVRDWHHRLLTATSQEIKSHLMCEVSRLRAKLASEGPAL